MIGRLEPMRRRLVEVPLRLDHPYWIDDPDFDLDYHVRHIGLAPPGAADQLAEQVARIVGRPMDRSHPLWECYVIEGLADGRWAMLTKTHHSTIDGASGRDPAQHAHRHRSRRVEHARPGAVDRRADPERHASCCS